MIGRSASFSAMSLWPSRRSQRTVPSSWCWFRAIKRPVASSLPAISSSSARHIAARAGNLPDEAELLDRLLPFLVAGAGLQSGIDLALPFQLARGRAGAVLILSSRAAGPPRSAAARCT